MTGGQTQQWTYVDHQQMQVRPWEYAESYRLYFSPSGVLKGVSVPCLFPYIYVCVCGCKQASIIDEVHFHAGMN